MNVIELHNMKSLRINKNSRKIMRNGWLYYSEVGCMPSLHKP